MNQPFQSLDPESQMITKIFDSFYEVPPNQREFSWNTKDQLQRFWEDLQGCINEDLVGTQTKNLGHFLGTIVTIGDKSSTYDRPHKVIDGQQRLTTITIFARVLLEQIDKEHPDDNKRTTYLGVLKNWVCVDTLGSIQPRLKLNRANDFYKKSVVELSSMSDRESYWTTEADLNKPAVKLRIVEALRFFHENILAYLDETGAVGTSDRIKALENLYYAISQLFYLLKMRVEDTRMAYRLFETLNERGMELSQADLVRNVVLEHAEKLSQTSFKKALKDWETFLDQVDSQDPALLKAPELIQFSYTSRHNSVKAERLFDVLSGELTKSKLSPVSFAADIEIDSIQWSSFLQGNLGYWNSQALDSHRFIIHINPIWKKHAVPLLLRVADRFDKKGKKTELGKALWAIECFLFREGTINKTPISELERVMGQAARNVGDPSTPDGAFISTLKSNSSDSIFIDNFKTATAKGKLAFYVAWRIENYVQGSGGFDMSTIGPVKQNPSQHLEHIMPRKPDASWGGLEQSDEFQNYLDRLGNHLVLEAKLNMSIKNGAFKNKLSNPKNKDYSNSKLDLPGEIVSNVGSWHKNNLWNFESIKKRQEYLANIYALDVWKIVW